MLFNIYVDDLKAEMKMKGYQYADDTTLYCHAKPKNLEFLSSTTNQSIEQLGIRASNNNLPLNRGKTKLMLLSTQEMSRRHGLEDIELNIHIKGKKMERTETRKLLGVTGERRVVPQDEVKGAEPPAGRRRHESIQVDEFYGRRSRGPQEGPFYPSHRIWMQPYGSRSRHAKCQRKTQSIPIC